MELQTTAKAYSISFLVFVVHKSFQEYEKSLKLSDTLLNGAEIVYRVKLFFNSEGNARLISLYY